ncbi:MAG: oligosaccharide flippase family protein [Acidobacteria bacterium]|nr:oligosaccharide flippase family protein [Acidobacteriota bacterium]
MTPDPNILPDVPSTAGDAAERRSSGWDIRNAPRNYIALVIFQAASALLSFGAVWLITRHLGSAGYGGIVAIIAASQVAQVFVNWTCVAVVRFGVDEFIETEKIARTFWLRFFILVVNLALVAILSPYWFPYLADWLKLSTGSFWLVMTHFAVTAFWLHIQMGLQGAKLMRMQGLLQMIERLLIFVGLFGLTSAAPLTPNLAIICYIIAPAAVMFFGLFELRKYVWTRFAVDRVFLQKFVAYSLPLLPFSLVGYFSGSYVDAVFVSKFLSTKDLGIYSVATQINGIALQLPTLANTLLLPLLVTMQSEGDNQRGINYFQNVLPSLTLLWGLACSISAFVAYFAIPLIFGTQFTEATAPLWVLLAGSVVSLPILIGYAAVSHAASRTYISLAAAILGAGTNLAANFLLIPSFGIEGCAWATVISSFASLFTFTGLLWRTGLVSPSWIYLALSPCLLGGIIFSFSKSPFAGSASCLVVSVLAALYRRAPIIETLDFLKRHKLPVIPVR